MSPRRRWISLVAVLLTLNAAALGGMYYYLAAGRPSHIRIMSTFPEFYIDHADRLGMTFDAPVVRADDVDKPLDYKPFRLEPAHPGRWIWAKTDRLEYRFDQQLHPGMAYRLTPSDAFSKNTGYTIVGESEFTFATRSLDVVSFDMQDSDDSSLNVRVAFNQPVAPASLKSMTTVTESDQKTPIAFDILSREAAEEMIIRLDRPLSGRARLSVSGQMTGVGAELAMGHPFVHDISVEAPFRIERANPYASAFETLQRVQFDFNRRLKYDQKSPTIRFEPDVDQVRTEVQWDQLDVRGAFVCGKKYKAIISAGLLDYEGHTLPADQKITFTMPDRSEAMRFPLRGGILNPKGNLLLDLQVVNCSEVGLSANRLHENNLVAHLRGENADATGRGLVDRTFKVEALQNQPTTIAVDLAEMFKKPLGVYQFTARSEDDYWSNTKAVVAVTDIGLTCKRERNGIFVWATSISTGAPAAGVTLKALTYNNQPLSSAVSADDGTAHLALPEKSPDGPAYVVVAKLKDDMNYCVLNERTWVPDELDLAGRTPPTTYDMMLYPERGVYRPGDTIHLSGIIRTADGFTPPPFPIWIRTRRPDGRETGAESVVPRPENQGLFHIDIHTRDDAQLGPYRFTATLPGSDDVLGETHALVETFLPIRLELRASADKPAYRGEERPTISVQGDYLFGKPAAGVDVAVTGRFNETRFRSGRYPKFTFGPREIRGEAKIEDVDAKLDDAGHVEITLNLPKSDHASQWSGRAIVTLTETGSRSVSAPVSFEYSNASRHLGLCSPPGRIVPANSAIELQWAQVDPDDNPATPSAFELTLERVEHDWVYQERNGSVTWNSVEHRTPIGKPATLNAEKGIHLGSTEIAISDPGEYLVTARELSSGEITELVLRAVDPDENARWAATEHPDAVDVIVKNEPVAPGQPAECVIQTPFAGNLLVTIEDEWVRHSMVIDVRQSPVIVELQAPPDLRGDAFVTATLLRPIDTSASKWLPNVARGVARLKVNSLIHGLPLEITGPSKMGSEECSTFTVRAAPPSNPDHPPVVHLWAVDDGILMTTAFQSPDPLNYYFSPRALTVESSDLFASLLPDLKRPKSMQRIGAAEDEKESDGIADLNRSPVAAPHREPAVVWLASQKTDAEGNATFDLHMPELSGRMRVMAVAVDGDRYGHAERNITITAPILMEAGWPRFLAPGDRAQIPVKLFNNTDDPIDIRLSHDSTSGLSVTFPNSEFIHVTPATPELVWLELTGSEMGVATVDIWARAKVGDDMLQAHSRAAFPVRPATALDTETVIERLIAGDKLLIQPPTGFLPDTTRTFVEVGGGADLQLQPAVEDLLEYPYGCVEQTSSRVWALLEAGEIVKDRVDEDSRFEHIDDMIRAGILRLWSMQTPSGGLAYWPGTSTPHLWGSAYAADVLSRAIASGRQVDRTFIADLAKYLDASLNNDDLKDDNMRAQICESLAAFEKPNRGWMSRLSERLDHLDLGGRASLARAWMLSGDPKQAKAALPKELPQLATLRTTGGRITSDISQLASMVRAMRMIDPDSPWIPIMIDRIQKAAKDGRWANTMESATAIAAIANDQKNRKPANYEGTLVSDEESLAFTHDKSIRHAERAQQSPIEIQTTGEGDAIVLTKYVGLRSIESLKDEDRGLMIRRRWLTPDNKPTDLTSFHVGDLITVEVKLSAPDLNHGGSIDNIAIVDALPAGFEVENPRLAGSAVKDEPAPAPDLVQFLDDRVLIFASAEKKSQTFRYHIRAVTAGDFVVPPIEATCMYDSTIASLQTAGQVEIIP